MNINIYKMTQRYLKMIRTELHLLTLVFCLLWSRCNSLPILPVGTTDLQIPGIEVTLGDAGTPHRGRVFTLLNAAGAKQIFWPPTPTNPGPFPVDDFLETQIHTFNEVHHYVTFKNRRACYITSNSSFNANIGATDFVVLNIKEEIDEALQKLDVNVIRAPCNVAKLFFLHQSLQTVQGGSHISHGMEPYCPVDPSIISFQVDREVRFWIAVNNTNLTQHSDVSPSNANIGVMFMMKINADRDVEMACGDLPEPDLPQEPPQFSEPTTSATSEHPRPPDRSTESPGGDQDARTGTKSGGLNPDHVTVIVVLLLLAIIAVLAGVVIVLCRKRRSSQKAEHDSENIAAPSPSSDSYKQLRSTASNITETKMSRTTNTSSAKSTAEPNVYERIDSIDIGDQYSEIPADIGDQPENNDPVVGGTDAKDSGSNPVGLASSGLNKQRPQDSPHTQTENTSSSTKDLVNDTTDTGDLYSKPVKTNTDKKSNSQKGGLHHNNSEQVFEENDVYEPAASIKPICEADETAANQIAGDYERPLAGGERVAGSGDRVSGKGISAEDIVEQTDDSMRASVVIMEDNIIYVSD